MASIYGTLLQLFPIQQILGSPKLKEFADDNLEFDGNGEKLSKRVENTVGKAVIACYEQILLLPQCFLKTREHKGLFGKWLARHLRAPAWYW